MTLKFKGIVVSSHLGNNDLRSVFHHASKAF